MDNDPGSPPRATPSAVGGSGRRHAPPETDPQLRIDLDGGRIGWRPVPARDEAPAPRRTKRRAFWRGLAFVFGGPIHALGADRIAESASVIGGLARHIRTGPPADERVLVYDDRTLDLHTMARDAGISVAQVRMLLGNRRRQTRRSVFCYLAGAAAFFGLWVWQASEAPAYTRLPYVVVLLLICAVFCLSAFYNALVNWQCRTERLGTWREFLSTDDSWWPS